MKILRGGGGLRKFLDTQKGGSEKTMAGLKICILQNQLEGGGGGRGGGGAPKKLNR